ncbi:chemotaxis protein CheX [Petroclostridium sp. X23]|uniref:chemotaxis protein CheX n=1 Tax=Petroclostridium sp. X23 TaxID=3045146 RepID=UPI0024ADA917|nr:chemotaxis protein CheX [Petroclostridium sp. X23]WHH61358.1 chemotaxis protein CheX [Petroclostridium sp. X23]
MEYINSFKDSIKEAFGMMFDENITLETESPAPSWISSKGVAVVVGITGEKKGRVLLDMSRFTAMELAMRMDSELNNEDLALFTIAEFCNIASGGAVTTMNNNYKKSGLRLVTPSIFSGTKSKIFSPSLKATMLSYTTRFGKIDFHIGFEGV